MKKLIRLAESVIRHFIMLVAAGVTLVNLVSTQAGARPKDTVIATISLDGSLFPESIVTNPKKPEVYVSCEYGNIYVGIPGITPDGAYLYVPIPYTTYTDPATGNTGTYDSATVAVINTKTRKVIDRMTFEWDPLQVAIGPAGKRAYVVYEVNGVATVAVIDITGS